MANGKVIVGYSLPYVAKYSAADNVVTYTLGQPMARGVSVDLKAEKGDDTNFYADNQIAETDGGVFTKGTATLVVDGLKKTARKMMQGLGEDETISVGSKQVPLTVYNDDQDQNTYVGIGFIIKYMESGVLSYTAVILTKALVSPEGLQAATKEDKTSFQTQSLEATIFRDDSAKHDWKKLAEDLASESEAYDVIKTVLGPKA